MSTPTITDDDAAILEYLADGPAERVDIADAVGQGDAETAERLDGLIEGGLVREVEDVYEITDSGERLLAAPADGTADSRVDTPPAVDEAIDEMDLAPDHAEAVEDAFAFLRFWGEATAAEVRDAVYSENPLAYADAESWWDEAIRDALADLPDIDPPAETDDGAWRYDGSPGREDGDGRRPFDVPETETYGSVKHALEAEDVTDRQRTAVSAAFELLQSRGAAPEEDLRTRSHDAVEVEASAGTWWRDAVEPVLARLPGVERTGDGRWRYSGDGPD
jgi:DNA-binding Lrp family transcriptional regulator